MGGNRKTDEVKVTKSTLSKRGRGGESGLPSEPIEITLRVTVEGEEGVGRSSAKLVYSSEWISGSHPKLIIIQCAMTVSCTYHRSEVGR